MDGQRLLLAESCPFGQSAMKSHRFWIAFEASERPLQDFYAEMPAAAGRLKSLKGVEEVKSLLKGRLKGFFLLIGFQGVLEGF